MKFLLLSLVPLLALALPGRAAAPAAPLRIAAAADLKFALDDLLAAFRKLHPACDPQPTYGSSGTLSTQIENGAPFDVFLSADIKFPRHLIEHAQADGATLFVYAIGHLVVWVPKASPLEVEHLGLRALLDPQARKVAIANPEVAPYGAAAVAAMKNLGLLDALTPKLVRGENVAQAAQFAESGAADAGVISLSLALAPKMQAAGRFGEVPADAFPKLEQAGVICARATNRPAAEQLCAFLQSDAGRTLLARFGFARPADVPAP